MFSIYIYRLDNYLNPASLERFPVNIYILIRKFARETRISFISETIGNPGSLCVTRDITRVNYREYMRRSLGLKVCEKIEIKIDETYHVARSCGP